MAHTSTSTDRSQRRPSEPYLSSLIRWLQLKKYQYEVTFSLYMLTSTEKFIFNFVLFVLISMLVAAASMYLPNHVVIIYRRIWYYVHGEIASITKSASGGGGGVGGVGDVVKTSIDGLGTSRGVDVVTATSRGLGEL
ncbi:hypothetical protein EPUS_01110 [Endocarpon pusillum Z07020]|uniref:Uncharacterized protein n=1 Tax=Endocarpon pusillum (strain Z07020 / HMAS-L-300199) TaxID=1263415 RepID=U1HJR2_ENDPU|nr:uncharacterized protein EPUS_01110 [Endocarpon pusillum Z07020]ERF69154.1 hypothetical protein EPUS_01110 [Endocarpon pusillum Z07020]